MGLTLVNQLCNPLNTKLRVNRQPEAEYILLFKITLY